MIHLNKGENAEHEWITEEEFKNRFPSLAKELARPTPHNEHGNKLKSLRLKKKITIREMSKRIGIGAPEICQIEQGKVKITTEINDRYCLALNY